MCECTIIDFMWTQCISTPLSVSLEQNPDCLVVGANTLVACKREGLKTLQAKPSSGDWLIPPLGATAGEFRRIFGY